MNENLKRTTFYIDKEVHKKLKVLAVENDKTVTDLLKELITDYLLKEHLEDSGEVEI